MPQLSDFMSRRTLLDRHGLTLEDERAADLALAAENAIEPRVGQPDTFAIRQDIAQDIATQMSAASDAASNTALSYETLRRAIDQLNGVTTSQQEAQRVFDMGAAWAERNARARRRTVREEPSLMEVWRD